jgi:hypothetical protein
MNFKSESTIIKLNNAVTNLNVWGISMNHCERDKIREYIHITG